MKTLANVIWTWLCQIHLHHQTAMQDHQMSKGEKGEPESAPLPLPICFSMCACLKYTAGAFGNVMSSVQPD
jgi:hypothetical protein